MMKTSLVCLLAVWIGVTSAFDRCRAETVAVDPARCAIVLPADARRQDQDAAQELQKHLGLISGRTIPVVSNEVDRAAGAYLFQMGIVPPDDTKPLASQESRWVITPTAAYFYGDKTGYGNGGLYAVYTFLEDQLGIHWIEPGDRGIVFKPASSFHLRTGAFQWIPKLMFRKIRQGDARVLKEMPPLPPAYKDYEEFQPTLEAFNQFANDVRRWQIRMRMDGHRPGGAHAFSTWWKRYGKTHPEYFALNKFGKREPVPLPDAAHTEEFVKICPSNPDVVRQIIENWLPSKGHDQYVDAGINDGAENFCACENCRKLDVVKEGEKPFTHLTDRYVYLANAVAREARKHRADARVTIYAYLTTLYPPRQQKIEPNVVVQVVPYVDPLDPKVADDLFGGWKKAGATMLALRPNYHTKYLTSVLPVGVEKQMFDVFQVAVRNGCVSADYDSLVNNWPVTAISDYILAKAMMDPSQPFEHWLDEFCSGYGAAAADVKQYYDYWRNELWEKRFRPNLVKICEKGGSGDFVRGLLWSLGDYYRDADFDATDAILKKAAARKLAEPQRKLVEELVLAHRGARLLVAAATTPGADKFAHSLQLIAFREQHHRPGVFNWLSAYASESRFGDASGAKIAYRLRTYPLPWIATGLAWWFKLDPNDVGLKEKWQEKPWAEISKWDLLRTDFYWDNPYRSETDPALVEKVVNYDGIAWYAVRQTIPPEMKGRKILLYFGAVGGSCQVYVNGKLAGAHPSQKPGDKHEPFTIRIDEFVDWERTEQTITVRIEDRSELGGIGKRVWLVSQK